MKNKQLQKKSSSGQIGHCHVSEVGQKKTQQRDAGRPGEEKNEEKPRIRIHKVKTRIEIDQTEEKGDKNEKDD